MWMDLFAELRPLLGELLAVVITALIALIKRKIDKNGIKNRVQKFLTGKGQNEQVISQVIDLIDKKIPNDKIKIDI